MMSLRQAPQVCNLGQAVLNSTVRVPDQLAIITDQSLLNYQQLGQLIQSFTARMQRLGVKRGSVVVLSSEDIFTVVPVFFACALLGARWIAFQNYRLLSDFVKPTHWFRSADGSDSVEYPFVLVEQDWANTEARETLADESIDLDAPFIYARTSGTTGTPKLLPISQRVLFDRGVAAADDFVERKTVFCSLFPPSANPYIARFVAALQNGATILHSHNFDLWYQCGMNHLYGSVSQVFELLGNVVLPKKLPMIHVSGSKCGDGLARHLLASFDQVIDLYASTETSRTFKNIKYVDEFGQLRTRGEKLDSDIEIVGEDGNPVGPGEVGLVRVRNGYFAGGYLNDPEAQAKAFRDGWFISGDFGQWNREGGLQILGRTGDVINRGGIKVNALAIDEILREVVGVADAMCFENPSENGPSELLAFVVFAPDRNPADVLEEIRKVSQTSLGLERTPNRVIAVPTVPRAHDGGAQRFRCQEIYRRMVASSKARVS